MLREVAAVGLPNAGLGDHERLEAFQAKLGEDGTKVQFFVETLRSNIPTMMLFCIPLFAFVDQAAEQCPADAFAPRLGGQID